MTRILPRLALAVLASTAALLAQDVVSARAGLIHYLEGKVYLQEQELDQTPSTKLFSRFPEVKENERLRTAMGRAEILLSPGAVLRIGEDSRIRMISNRLIDTRLELESGSAVVDVSELQKENSITILVKDATVQLRKSGLYRLSASPAMLMVYDGQADVVADDVRKTVKKGTSLTMEGAITASKFDTERGDSLLRWSLRRSGYLAMANISAAKSLRDSGYAWSGGWQWNPFFGMFTFIPARGIACNGFTGMCFYSPQRIYSVFYRPVMPSYHAGFGGGGVRYGWDGAGGYAVASQRTYGGYPAGAAAGAGGAPAAAAAPVGDAGGVRGAEAAVGRGSAGGRGQ